MAEVAYLEAAVLNPEVAYFLHLPLFIYTLILLKHVTVALICMLYLTCFYFFSRPLLRRWRGPRVASRNRRGPWWLRLFLLVAALLGATLGSWWLAWSQRCDPGGTRQQLSQLLLTTPR